MTTKLDILDTQVEDDLNRIVRSVKNVLAQAQSFWHAAFESMSTSQEIISALVAVGCGLRHAFPESYTSILLKTYETHLNVRAADLVAYIVVWKY